MEIKINREIRNYTEAMFFGLSLRQFVFSVLACGVAVGVYFLLKPYVGTETVSWMCILAAAPFAALGFIKYNGMTAEKFVWAWIKSEFLMPKKLVFHSTNTYFEYRVIRWEVWKWKKHQKLSTILPLMLVDGIRY